jgi:NitT/TauT family transport system permease protein
MKKLSRQIIFYCALIGIWALLAKLHIWPPYLFPPPRGVGEALWAGFQDHSFWIGIMVTMKRMLVGYSLSVVLGMILGLGVGSYKFLEDTLGGLLVSLQSLPSICWIPLAVLWFGLLLPASLPFIVSGLKQGFAFGWRSLIQAEMIFLSLGLGQLLMMGRDLNDMSQVIAVMILIIILGFIIDGLVFRTMERKLQERWGLIPA